MREVVDFTELKASGDLPTPKGVALRVMELCQDENLSLALLAQTIQADPALSGRIIKIANFVNPNRARPIASVTTDTLIMIGINAVRQLVLGLSLISNYRDGFCKRFDYAHFWSHAVAMASAAQAIGNLTRIAVPAEMFNCGLMSGIGQLALATARPEAYSDLLAEHPDVDTKTLHEAQLSRFGMTQRSMMVFLLQDWGIPKLFIDALYFHEDPMSSGYAENSRPLRLTYSLQLAALLACTCTYTEIDHALLSRIKVFGSLLELDAEQLNDLIKQTRTEWREWCVVLNIRASLKRPAEKKPDEVAGSPVAELKSAEITVPLTPTPPIAAEQATVAEAVHPLRVLIVSGNELQCNVLNRSLAASGHHVSVVDNGMKALEMLPSCQPQVVIADWMLQEMDCRNFCRALRKHALGEKLYLMVLTQFEDERHQVDAYDAGADNLIRTPLNQRLLNAKLTAALRHTQLVEGK